MTIRNKVFLVLETILTLGCAAWSVLVVYLVTNNSSFIDMGNVRNMTDTSYLVFTVVLLIAQAIGLIILLMKRSKRWMMIIGSVYTLISTVYIILWFMNGDLTNYVPLYLGIPSLVLGHVMMILSFFAHGSDVEMA